MSNYAVVNPATGDKVKEYPDISDDELDAAIGKSWDTHREWSLSKTPAERAALVQRVADLHIERRDALAEIAVREMGKPIEQALGEVDFCGDIYGYYAERAEQFLTDEPIDLLAGEGTAVIRKSAMGPLIGIMPWNFPYYQVARFAGPNLIVGNTILLKPAPQCPESAAAIQEIYDDAGFPAGRLPDDPRHQRADRRGDRRPAGARGVGDRLRAGRRGGRRGRRPQPQEGGARAGRVRPVHPARDARTSTRRSRRRSTPAWTTPASPATPRSGSSSRTTSTTTSSRSSRRR